MALIQTAASKFSVVYIAVSVLLVYNSIVGVDGPDTNEESCPENCKFINDLLDCSGLGLNEIAPTNLAQHVLNFVFSNNKLKSLTDVAFQDYHILEYLNLSENEIEEVSDRAFHGLTKLKNIDLSRNNLLYINPAIFSQNDCLEKVSFRGNPLSYYPDFGPILASDFITILDLSHCTLTSVNSDTFSQLPKLKVLNLNSNLLREINSDTLNSLTDLSNVDLQDNNWKCDCKIVDVLNMLSKKTKSESMGEEHSLIKCYEEGKYRTITTSVCAVQAEKQRGTFVEPKPEESISNETSIISALQELEEKVDMLGNTINKTNTRIGTKSKAEECTLNKTFIISALQKLEKKVDMLGNTVNETNYRIGTKSKAEECTLNKTSIISALQKLEKKVDMLGSTINGANSRIGMKSKAEESTLNGSSIISALQKLEKKVDMLGNTVNETNSRIGTKSKAEECTLNKTAIISALQELEKKVDMLGYTINETNYRPGTLYILLYIFICLLIIVPNVYNAYLIKRLLFNTRTGNDKDPESVHLNRQAKRNNR